MTGLTANGFVAKTFVEIRTGFETKQRATIDAGIDTSDDSLLGQLNGIMATEIAGVWELAEELNDASDPDKATDASQDALYSLTETLREAAKKTTVIATVVLAPATNIEIGTAQASVFGNASAKFVNDQPMVNASGVQAPFSVRFVATAPGPVVANAATLTVIDTPLAGWVSITNPLDATIGALIEGNAAYRLRRIKELAAQGGGTVPGIRADLLQTATVRAAFVQENYTDFPVGTLPPHSIEAIVRSDVGANDESVIAQTIWRNKAGGIQTVGSVGASATDSTGAAQPVRFSRPTELPVYIQLRITKNPSAYIGDTEVKTAVAIALTNPASDGFVDVSDDVYAGRIVSEVMKLGGVLNAEARLGLTALEAANPSAPLVLVMGQREIATFDTTRIAITTF